VGGAEIIVNWESFLRGTDKGLRIAALGFFIGVVGVGLGALSASVGVRWLGICAWLIVLAGWVIGAYGVLRGWMMMFRRRGQ